MIVAGTGHRPNKVGGYGPLAASMRQAVAREALVHLGNVSCVISGMALGWDQDLTRAAIDLKIPFMAYIPFIGQEYVWPPSSQIAYNVLLSKASSIVVVSLGGYDASKMQRRNEAMVDACDKVLALWDGSAGGTANCVRYARAMSRPIVNCWKTFKERTKL